MQWQPQTIGLLRGLVDEHIHATENLLDAPQNAVPRKPSPPNHRLVEPIPPGRMRGEPA